MEKPISSLKAKILATMWLRQTVSSISINLTRSDVKKAKILQSALQSLIDILSKQDIGVNWSYVAEISKSFNLRFSLNYALAAELRLSKSSYLFIEITGWDRNEDLCKRVAGRRIFLHHFRFLLLNSSLRCISCVRERTLQSTYFVNLLRCACHRYRFVTDQLVKNYEKTE